MSKDALRDFREDFERARGNLEEALANATRKAFSQRRFNRVFKLPVVEVDVDVEIDSEDEDDIVEALITKAQHQADDLIEEALRDDWEIDQAVRRLKATLDP